MKKLILSITALVALGAMNTASADTLRSPRAQENKDVKVQIQARATGGRADRPVLIASPRAAEQQTQRSYARSGDASSVVRAAAGPEGPRFQSPRAAEQFYIAPLK